jgi:hypothetical protein
MTNLKPIEEEVQEQQTNIVPIPEETIEPKPGEVNIKNLPDWNIEPPVEINRGNK